MKNELQTKETNRNLETITFDFYNCCAESPLL